MFFRKPRRFDPGAFNRWAENWSPSIGTVLYHGAKTSFETNSLALVGSLIRNSAARGSGDHMTEDIWRSSRYYRPGLEYDEEMTTDFAEVLANSYDTRRESELVYERTGALGATAYFGSALIGALADPINLVPFMRFVPKGAILRSRMAVNALGRVGIGAAEGGLGAATLQPLYAAERLSYQERYDAKMAATDILVGIGAGGVLSGVMEGGRLALKKYSVNPNTGAQTPIEEPRVLRQLFRWPIETLTKFGRRAVIQVDEGRPVDVAGTENPGTPGPPHTQERLTIDGLGEIGTEVPGAREVQTRFELVEHDSVIASNLDEGNTLTKNPAYKQDLQPRDRDTAESLQQILEISGEGFRPRRLVYPDDTGKVGAPVVGPDNMVESGNGRILALGRIFKNKGPNLANYKTTMKQFASMYGIDPAKIDSMSRPILIRRRTTDLDHDTRVALTQRLNTDEIAARQPDEVAVSDATMMDDNILRFLNDAELDAEVNIPFVNAVFDTLPAAERKGLTTNGKINPAGLERLELALYAKAYHSPQHPEFMKQLITMGGEDFRQIANALKNTARRWVYMKSKMRTGEFINEDPTNYLIESVLQFNDLKRKLRKKAAEKDKKGKAIGFRKVLQDHVKILHRQHNLDPDIGTHAETVLFLDFLSVADSQQKIEAGLRSFIADVEAHPIGQQGFFEQPPMAEILDRTIGAHRTEAKVDAQTAETPTRPPTEFVPEKLLSTIKRLIISGETSKKYIFNTTNTLDPIIDNGLNTGGFAGSPIGDRGLGGFVHVFLRSDLPKSLRDKPPQMVELESDYKPIKPIWTFLSDDLELPDSYGFRSQELGDGPQPPTELSSAELAAVKKNNQRDREDISDLYQAREAFDETKVREEVESEQIHAQDEEIDFQAREEEDIIEEIPEQGPSDQELEQLEALADQELNQVQDWNPEKELAEIEELERIGDAMDEKSPMMNCILGKL